MLDGMVLLIKGEVFSSMTGGVADVNKLCCRRCGGKLSQISFLRILGGNQQNNFKKSSSFFISSSSHCDLRHFPLRVGPDIIKFF